MLGPVIPAAVGVAPVMADKDALGAVAVAPGAAVVGALGLFGVVGEGALELVEQAACLASRAASICSKVICTRS